MAIASLDLDPALRRRTAAAPDCSVDRALQVVSTRSAMLLMREVFYGVTRFDELTARVGISEPVAAARLKELVARGCSSASPTASRASGPATPISSPRRAPTCCR